MMRQLQNLGRALMQPVAVLPAAAILMGIGYWIDPAGWGGGSPVASFFIKSGAAILDNLGMLFAVGVAYGLSKDKNGAAALSGMVAFFIITTLLSPGSVANLQGVPVEQIPATNGFGKINNPFIGILSGIIASMTYNRFYQVKLPDALAFFSGRRLTPIMTAFFMIIISGIMYFVWPMLFSGLVSFGEGIAKMGPVGAGIYGFLNRLLIPTGLHHALNSVFWFDTIGINDIGNFWSSTPSQIEGITTGMFQAGFFPIMMFGLPGAALAMYHTANAKQKKFAASLLLAGAVSSFFTGVTEPIEFAFMFLAPGLYLLHAVLTGISVFIAASMQWISGFGFSAGFIDYFLSMKMPLATNNFMLIPLGLAMFFIYYFTFKFCILKFNLKTPGRDDAADNEGVELDVQTTNFSAMATHILTGLGGKDNIAELDHCATRLRIEVKDHLLVKEDEIRKANIAGIMRPGQNSVQVVVGPQVQFAYDELAQMMK